jgi:hypothetical protein
MGLPMLQLIGTVTPMGKDRTANQVATTRARVERWLVEMDYAVSPIVREEVVWGLAGERRGQVGIAVAQIVGHTDQVYLQTACRLEDGFKDRIALLAADERQELIWDIRFRLILFDTSFDGVEEPLTVVNFADTIFIEALNRTSFAASVSRILRSYTALSFMLQRRFPDVKTAEIIKGLGSKFINGLFSQIKTPPNPKNH